MIRLLLLLVAISASMFVAKAQTIQLIARNTADSVVLRWAPVDHVAWERNNQYGHKVERFEIHRDLQGKAQPHQLNDRVIKPWTLEEFQAGFPPDDRNAAAAAQALYGKTFTAAPTINDMNTIADASNESQMRYSFALLGADLDARTATALGLRWVDRDLRNDRIYLYQVTSLDPEAPDTARVAVNRGLGPDIIGKTPTPVVVEEEGQISLQWDNDVIHGTFTAFWIERRQGQGEWIRLTRTPFLQASQGAQLHFTDTTISRNYLPYTYRIIGITPFAETAGPSAEITGMGRDRTPPEAPEIIGVTDEMGVLVVRWRSTPPPDMKGFRVEKAYSALSGFVPLHEGWLTANTREFSDDKSELLGENHYRVVASDTAGNLSFSLAGYGSLVDSIPPAIPEGLMGSIDSIGNVTLHWRLGSEPDILGYRVFFANQADHEFSNLTPEPHQDTSFTHATTLHTLTRGIHYRVVAVDRNFNHSGMSDMITLQRPDTIAPVAPLFSKYVITDSSVVLGLIPSSSPDAAQYDLFRKAQTSDSWDRIHSWPADMVVREYYDKDVAGPMFYSYSIQVTDSAGNVSKKREPLDVRVPPSMKVPGPETLEVQHDKNTNSAVLKWRSPAAPVKHYVVYRAKDGAAPVAIASVPGENNTWVDDRLIGKGGYRYLLKAVYPSGATSAMVESKETMEVR